MTILILKFYLYCLLVIDIFTVYVLCSSRLVNTLLSHPIEARFRSRWSVIIFCNLHIYHLHKHKMVKLLYFFDLLPSVPSFHHFVQ